MSASDQARAAGGQSNAVAAAQTFSSIHRLQRGREDREIAPRRLVRRPFGKVGELLDHARQRAPSA